MFLFEVDKTKIVAIEKEQMTSGSVKVYTVHFEFSTDWEGFTKTAVFKAGSIVRNVHVGDSSECIVPWEVLVMPNVKIQIGVYGEDNSGSVLPTVWTELGPVLLGVVAGDGSDPAPTPDSFQESLDKKGDTLRKTDSGLLSLYSGSKLLSSVSMALDKTPIQGSTKPVESGGIYESLSEKQDKIIGSPGQVVGFAEDGTAVPQEAPAFKSAVTVPGGATTEMAPSFGEGPYTFQYVDDEEDGGPVSAGQVSYDNAASGVKSTTVQSAIDWVSSVILTGGVPYGKELTESWASLQARIKAGNFAGIRIGDFKTITLTTGETVVMEVAGIDQNYRCGNTEIGHHVDFISRDCLAGTKVFNDTATNQGTAAEPNPWRASKLFQTLNDEVTGVYGTLPDDLKSCIIEKLALLEKRFSEAGALNDAISWAWVDMGKLWLPMEVEVFGNAIWSDGSWGGGGGSSKQYPIFIGNSLHLIKDDSGIGARCNWWLASAARASADHVCCVRSHGASYGVDATNGNMCAPLCFRIG